MATKESEGFNQTEMQRALRDVLETNGTIAPVKAQLRAAVFDALTASQQRGSSTGNSPLHAVPHSPETLLLNELILEYLEFQGYQHTAAVFSKESRASSMRLPRSMLVEQARLPGAPAEVPVIFAMLSECRGSE